MVNIHRCGDHNPISRLSHCKRARPETLCPERIHDLPDARTSLETVGGTAVAATPLRRLLQRSELASVAAVSQLSLIAIVIAIVIAIINRYY